MFDVKWIRDNPDAFDAGLDRRGLAPLSARLIELDAARRAAQGAAQEIQSERNTLSRQIGIAKGKGEDAGDLMARVLELKNTLGAAEDEVRTREAALKA